MKYISTRGQAPALGFCDTMLAGLAGDGGLYVPETWPQFTPAVIAALAGKPYAEAAFSVIRPFIGGEIDDDALAAICDGAYAEFRHPAVVPLTQLGPSEWVLELFHGPTLAFKDVAMQLLARLMDHVLAERGSRVTIVGATSGDTGAAAIEAFRGRDNVDVFILFPEGRVSPIQQRQMTTVDAGNVHALAVKGTFDDCQDQVKAMFNDLAFRDAMNLSAVNSINWARIMAQIVYYFVAGVALGAPDRAVAFSVPSGNFGNVFAAYGAGRMGLPVAQLIVGSNKNDILTRFFESGSMKITGVSPTISPSMDIQVSSNFERLLYDVLDGDGAQVRRVMQSFRQSGEFAVSPEQLQRLRRLFDAQRYDDAQTGREIAARLEAAGELLDPHTAIATAAARDEARPEISAVVALATAHAAKFPDAVEKASGHRPELPARLADLYEREERCVSLPNDLVALQDYIRSQRQDPPQSQKGAA